MSKVASFDVDHRTLEPGLYLRSVYKPGIFTKINSWDLRFKKPNTGYLASSTLHTIEHLLAFYLRQSGPIKDKVVYVGPMGCTTGFYLLTDGCSVSEVRQSLIETIEYILKNVNKQEQIPGMNEVQCGNYKLTHLQGALIALRNYLEVLKK